jgi:hypothetical protein
MCMLPPAEELPKGHLGFSAQLVVVRCAVVSVSNLQAARRRSMAGDARESTSDEEEDIVYHLATSTSTHYHTPITSQPRQRALQVH